MLQTDTQEIFFTICCLPTASLLKVRPAIKWITMAPIVLFLFMANLVLSCKMCTYPAVNDPGPKRIIFFAELGPVSFPHRSHQQSLKTTCVQCHHAGSESDYHCRHCHKRKIDTGEGDPNSFFDVKMQLCRGCHQQLRDNENSQRAPIHCTECHDVKKIQWHR